MKKSLFASALCIAASLMMPAYGAGDAEAGKAKAAVCNACHGADGVGLVPEYPNLAGQGESYIVKQLMEFKEGTRVNTLMSPMALPLSEQDMEDLAAHFSAMTPKAGVAAEENLELGQSIYRGGITSAKIPACIGCHGPSGSGNPAAKYPAISGQNLAYLESTLKAFRSGERSNDPNQMMRSLAHRMSDEEIAAVSNYIQGLH
ncbi:MAG: cytochrome c4 [Gammaproteobacteria bacterium]|nr:cytochrome c4 [Gammaproteobacteria bacterium]